ncbi:hypothetical protein M1146_07895, partial [Patescibacteria group bacterium]|nr:hypothetical protein [Patescibacteria group bacterium]
MIRAYIFRCALTGRFKGGALGLGFTALSQMRVFDNLPEPPSVAEEQRQRLEENKTLYPDESSPKQQTKTTVLANSQALSPRSAVQPSLQTPTQGQPIQQQKQAGLSISMPQRQGRSGSTPPSPSQLHQGITQTTNQESDPSEKPQSSPQPFVRPKL